jgi:hypothetical protein
VCHLYAAPEGCDLLDKTAWAAANPALGLFRSLDDLQEQMTQAQRMPSMENTARNLLLNQRVEVDSVAIDTYGRTIAHIRVGALRVNQEMVRRGLVWVSTRGGDQHGLLALQREARRERIGLWQDTAPTPPWAWRRAQSASSPAP